MKKWKNEDELFKLMPQKLYTSVIWRHYEQARLSSSISLIGNKSIKRQYDYGGKSNDGLHQGVEEEIIMEAFEKAGSEQIVKSEINEGMSACKAFAKYGIM